MDNSIKLKELQVVNGVLRKGDEGLGFLFLFQKGFLGEEGRMGSFQRMFFLRDWDRWIFLGTWTNPKGCFLGGMGGKSLVVFQGKKVGLFQFSKELFFWWCGMGCLENVDLFFLLWYGDLMKNFSQENIL